jgi:hypothetical protein
MYWLLLFVVSFENNCLMKAIALYLTVPVLLELDGVYRVWYLTLCSIDQPILLQTACYHCKAL